MAESVKSSANPSSAEREPIEIPIVNVTQLDDLHSISHPYFTCGATIQHLRQTKVMFLMRGLPGSGKSTLVSLLKQLYPKSLVVCSADHYFLNDQGVYVFNRDKIADAHLSCQQKADDAMRNGVLTVIIDNTNVRRDECKPYFQKANKYGYLILIVEPRTSWKRDATILAERNTHQVPKEVIEARLRQYHPLIPYFFGLFLNEDQSNQVLHRAYEFYQQALQTLPELKKDFELISRNKSISVNNYLSRSNMASPTKILHCTMKFIGPITDQNRKEFDAYASNRIVAQSLGKMFRAWVVGFSITPRTLAARLLLPDRQSWALWAQDDAEPFSEGPKSSAGNHSDARHRSGRRNPRATIEPITTDAKEDADQFDTTMSKSLADDDLLLVNQIQNLSLQSDDRLSFFRPTSGFLSRAHFTCAVAPGVGASQAGIDMVEMIRKEGAASTNEDLCIESEDEFAVIRYFDRAHAMVYLKEPMKLQTIFTGSFH